MIAARAGVVEDRRARLREAGERGPRLARTSLLAAYGSESGRVTASGVERARYDLEQGRHRTAEPAEGDTATRPMRFRARRTT